MQVLKNNTSSILSSRLPIQRREALLSLGLLGLASLTKLIPGPIFSSTHLSQTPLPTFGSRSCSPGFVEPVELPLNMQVRGFRLPRG
jgi:hypothetical protein